MHRPDEPPGGEDSPERGLTAIGRYGGYGLTIGGATALFAWLGSLLDGRLCTAPLFVLLGTFVGFGASFYSMYRRLVPGRGGDAGAGGDAGGDGEKG